MTWGLFSLRISGFCDVGDGRVSRPPGIVGILIYSTGPSTHSDMWFISSSGGLTRLK